MELTYQQYKEKIQDIQYIFNSGIEDILDLQYILVLIHESIYSCGLTEEIKNVLNRIKIKSGFNSKDSNDINYYYYILNNIKSDLNQFEIIQDSTENQLKSLLIELDQKFSTEEVNSQKTPIQIEEECTGLCSSCGIQCHSESAPLQETKTFENIEEYSNNSILDIKDLNTKYLKEYLIVNKILKNECSICGLTQWQNSHLQMELDFIDKNKTNKNLNNIRLLCPNCFSQVGYL